MIQLNSKKEFPGQTVNLDSLCRKLNVNNTRKNYHGALLDATLLSKVYLKLTIGKQEALNLINKEFNELTENEENRNIKNNFLSPRYQLMKLSDFEEKEHKKFLGKMGDPIWERIE